MAPIALPNRSIALSPGPLSPGSNEPPGSRNNALANKVTSILSSSIADIEIRDALETLDRRELHNTADTRRNLRRDIQKELIDINGEIVNDFGQVATQLRTVGASLDRLQNTISSIRSHVSLARAETKPLLDEAATLISQNQHVEQKRHVLSAFNSHFLLSDDELKTLTVSAEPVNDDFFSVLVKTKRIHADSQHLLGGQNQRLGLEILEQSTRHLNAAFQKLYRFLQREFKTLDLENPRITASVRRALRVLAERPSLFQNCLDTFAENRERTLSDAFYGALTGSQHYQGDNQKPIDFSAHEPLRYVGDMLAWAHGTAVSEREALEGLFISEGDEISKGISQGLESEPWSRTRDTGSEGSEDEEPAEQFDGQKALSQLVNRSLAGVAHLLVQRVDTVIHSHDEPVLAYKIANLALFYRNIFTRLVNESGFLETLDKIKATALERFQTTMQQSITSLESEYTTGPQDFSPPDFLPSALEALSALLKSYDTSITSATKAAPTSTSPKTPDQSASETPQSLTLIFTAALSPHLNLLHTLSKTYPSHLNSTIFLHNALSSILPILQAFPHLTNTQTTALETELETLTQRLTNETHAFLLSTSGLSPLLHAINKAGDNALEASKAVAFERSRLSQISEQLDAFLPSAVMDAEARLGGLKEKDVVREVVREACGRFVGDFERVEGVVEGIDEVEEGRREREGSGKEDDDGEEEGLRSVFPRRTEDVRVLLS